MSPRDLLEVTDEWAAGTREAEWRSAVSRAYYAAFHSALALLRQCNFDVPQGDQAHAYLWRRLANAGHPDVQRVGQRLNYLRTLRNRADYDLDQPFLQAVALAQVQVADDILQLLETVPTIPTILARITEAMRIYERDVLKEVTWQP